MEFDGNHYHLNEREIDLLHEAVSYPVAPSGLPRIQSLARAARSEAIRRDAEEALEASLGRISFEVDRQSWLAVADNLAAGNAELAFDLPSQPA